MQENTWKINCIIFQKQEPIIKNITDKINMAKGIQEKARYAEELQRELNVLLSCPDYDVRVDASGNLLGFERIGMRKRGNFKRV